MTFKTKPKDQAQAMWCTATSCSIWSFKKLKFWALSNATKTKQNKNNNDTNLNKNKQNLTLVLLRGGCTNPPNGFRPGVQNRTAKG